jgi:uncharacterized repeat protein (TIGR04138 family)
MTNVDFADEILDRLKTRNPRFDGQAYLFLLSSLQRVIRGMEKPRHISGAELAAGARILAIEQFGLLARTVLEHWGIHSTEDFGEIVFALVEAGILVAETGDRIEDFRGLFEFEEAFDRSYPWATAG